MWCSALFSTFVLLGVQVQGNEQPSPASISNIQVFSSVADWTKTINVRSYDTSDCLFGTISCPGGQEVCLNPIDYIGCTFDAISPINLDEILPAIGDALSDFTDDPISYVASFAESLINGAIDDVKTCVKGLSGDAPQCSELSTFSSCLSAAGTVLIGLKATSTLTAAEAKRLEKGLDSLDTVTSLINDQCQLGCEDGVCTETTRTFQLPDSCQCVAMVLQMADGTYSVTPDQCARNTASFAEMAAGSTSDAALFAEANQWVPSAKISLTYMGCYVGTTDTSYLWASSCPSAVPSEAFPNAWFVPCVDQYGQLLELDANGNVLSSVPTPSSMAQHSRSDRLHLLPILVAMICISLVHLW